MRQLRQWTLTLGALAFLALPMLVAGCAENQATSSDPAPQGSSATDTGDDLGELGDLDNLEEMSGDLGTPMESGSGLGGVPESGSGLGEIPESGSVLE